MVRDFNAVVGRESRQQMLDSRVEIHSDEHHPTILTYQDLLDVAARRAAQSASGHATAKKLGAKGVKAS